MKLGPQEIGSQKAFIADHTVTWGTLGSPRAIGYATEELTTEITDDQRKQITLGEGQQSEQLIKN